MANISSASVTLHVDPRVAPALRALIDSTNDGGYDILGHGYDEERIGDLVELSGNATGRWTYTNNLDGYFDGHDGTPSWLRGEALPLWQELVKVLEATNSSVRVAFVDIEPGEQILMKASATVVASDGTTRLVDAEATGFDWTVANMREAAGYHVRDAICEIYGDEAADAFFEWAGQTEPIEGKLEQEILVIELARVLAELEGDEPDEWLDIARELIGLHHEVKANG